MTSKPRIYLDSSALGRPYDDQSQRRIFRETQALLVILGGIRSKAIELVTSEVLEYEKELNPDAARRRWVEFVLTLAKMRQPVTDAIEERAGELLTLGLKPIDAAHAASAEAAGAGTLVACDDRFIKRYRGPLLITLPEKFMLDWISGL